MPPWLRMPADRLSTRMNWLTKMDFSHYYECYLQADTWAGDLTPERKPISLVLNGTVWGDVSTAVYIAVDGSNDVHYVGSVCRESLSGLRARFKGHEQTARFAFWKALYIIPLLAGTPTNQVRSIEGEVGRMLNPPGNVRLPTLSRG